MDKFVELVKYHLPAMAMISAHVRRHLNVDWSIPATWVIGSALTLLVQTICVVGIVAWRTSSIVTTLEGVKSEHVLINAKVDSVQTENSMIRIEQQRLQGADAVLNEKMSGTIHRVDVLENVTRDFTRRR